MMCQIQSMFLHLKDRKSKIISQRSMPIIAGAKIQPLEGGSVFGPGFF